jgi:hypothetical protein
MMMMMMMMMMIFTFYESSNVITKTLFNLMIKSCLYKSLHITPLTLIDVNINPKGGSLGKKTISS